MRPDIMAGPMERSFIAEKVPEVSLVFFSGCSSSCALAACGRSQAKARGTRRVVARAGLDRSMISTPSVVFSVQEPGL